MNKVLLKCGLIDSQEKKIGIAASIEENFLLEMLTYCCTKLVEKKFPSQALGIYELSEPLPKEVDTNSSFKGEFIIDTENDSYKWTYDLECKSGFPNLLNEMLKKSQDFLKLYHSGKILPTPLIRS